MEKFLKRKPLAPTSGKTTEKPTSNQSNHSNEREESNVKNRRSESNLLWTNVRGNIGAVNALFDVAKLSHLKGEVQQIEFSEPLLSGDYRLLQVDPELADQIEKGSSLTFRGELDDYPVLCTKDTTYCVKEAETSNTLLVLPQLDFINDKSDENERILATRKVIAMQSRYLELKKINVVSSSRLRELLRENELQWDADEQADENMEQNAKLYTFDDLLDVVQMSEVQLRQALQHLPVIQQNGYYRMLSSIYRDQLLMELTDCCDDDEEPDIQINSIRLKTLTEALQRRNPTKEIPSDAVLWLLKAHCTVVNGLEEGDETSEFALDERAVCRSKISQLLRAAVRFEYSAFEKLIRQMLPEGIEMKDEYLNGLALVEESITRGKTVRYMNVEDMPEEETKRLELLFSIRQKWKISDIQHFFTDLCPTTRDLNAMLAKHCRHSTGGNEQYLIGLK